MKGRVTTYLALDSFVLRLLFGLVLLFVFSNILFIGLDGGHQDRSRLSALLIKQLDFDQEKNLANWVLSMILFLNGLCAYSGTSQYWSLDKRCATS